MIPYFNKIPVFFRKKVGIAPVPMTSGSERVKKNSDRMNLSLKNALHRLYHLQKTPIHSEIFFFQRKTRHSESFGPVSSDVISFHNYFPKKPDAISIPD